MHLLQSDADPESVGQILGRWFREVSISNTLTHLCKARSNVVKELWELSDIWINCIPQAHAAGNSYIRMTEKLFQMTLHSYIKVQTAAFCHSVA